MSELFKKEWWSAAGTRAIKTICQTVISVIGVSTAMGEVDWRLCVSSAVLAGILSLVTSMAGLPEVHKED